MKMFIFIFINDFFLSPIVVYCSFSCSLTSFAWPKLKAQTAVNQTGSLNQRHASLHVQHIMCLCLSSATSITRHSATSHATEYLHGQLRYGFDYLGLRTRTTIQPQFEFSYIPKANFEAAFCQEVCIGFLQVFWFRGRSCHCYRFRRR